jgi:hypothetical protein
MTLRAGDLLHVLADMMKVVVKPISVVAHALERLAKPCSRPAGCVLSYATLELLYGLLDLRELEPGTLKLAACDLRSEERALQFLLC